MKATIEAELNITTPQLELSTIVDRDYEGNEVTLADKICKSAVSRLAKDASWNGLTVRVHRIRDEEIRRQVGEIVAEAISADVRRTNSFGEPTGDAKTLREVIVEEARAALTKPVDPYDRGRGTLLQKIIREEIGAAFRKELVEVVAEERAKVVAAVRAQAADLIARAVVEGVGGAK